MRVRCWGRTEAGRRSENQDAIAFTGVGVALDGELLEAEVDVCSDIHLALLADGVGGSADGRWAAHTALSYLHSVSLPDAREATVSAAIADAARCVAARSNGPGSSATTLAGLALGDGFATVFHVGDSRVYSLSPGPLRQLTADHRSRTDSRAISRFLGGSPAHALPSVSSARLLSGSWFLLASDGVYAFVGVPTLGSLDLSDPGKVCEGLIKEALAAGSDDNLSVLLVAVG